MGKRDGKEEPGDAQAAKVVSGEGGALITGVATEAPERQPAPVERLVKKVGFIVNDTLQGASEHSVRTGRLLTSKGVHVMESHSASPEKTVRWTQRDGLDLIFT